MMLMHAARLACGRRVDGGAQAAQPLPHPPLAHAPLAGRAGNRWESPGGCLMFTALKRLALPGQRLPFVQYIVSLAVVQAVQAEAAARLQVAQAGAGGGGSIAVLSPAVLGACMPSP